jgi:regulation of enolase protein 1 (concanavalin A-like superfamily)
MISSFSDTRLKWHCEPSNWNITGGRLVIAPDSSTDFWSKTHYGFEADNGHFLYANIAGDFVLSAEIFMTPRHQYDQAGLMVRVSKSCWLKTSIEFEPDNMSRLGAVVTNGGYSDWSTQDVPSDLNRFQLRVRRERGDYLVHMSLDGDDWKQLRVAHLHEDVSPEASVECGVYACSPKTAGFNAEFDKFVIDSLTENAKSPADPG